MEAVKGLVALGVDVWIVTGDSETAARCVVDSKVLHCCPPSEITINHRGVRRRSMARFLGVRSDRVLAEVMPQNKKVVVADLQAKQQANGESTVVAMVGDGVNDSPALAQVRTGSAGRRPCPFRRRCDGGFQLTLLHAVPVRCRLM